MSERCLSCGIIGKHLCAYAPQVDGLWEAFEAAIETRIMQRVGAILPGIIADIRKQFAQPATPRKRFIASQYGQGELPACHVTDSQFYYKPTRFYGYDALKRAHEYADFLNAKADEG